MSYEVLLKGMIVSMHPDFVGGLNLYCDLVTRKLDFIHHCKDKMFTKYFEKKFLATPESHKNLSKVHRRPEEMSLSGLFQEIQTQNREGKDTALQLEGRIQRSYAVRIQFVNPNDFNVLDENNHVKYMGLWCQ